MSDELPKLQGEHDANLFEICKRLAEEELERVVDITDTSGNQRLSCILYFDADGSGTRVDTDQRLVHLVVELFDEVGTIAFVVADRGETLSMGMKTIKKIHVY